MKSVVTALLATVLIMAVNFAVMADYEGVQVIKTKASFSDVKQDLADAIINRGYIVDYNARIGEMLDRTGKDVGSTKAVFKSAETVQFCSAVLSRKMMEADPANIAFCPYVIFYYERADEPGTVYVGFRELDEHGSEASEISKKTINKLLKDIIKEAAGS